eukprot:scaffold94885_cov69-Phaeocystis_antarctica.AAC.7
MPCTGSHGSSDNLLTVETIWMVSADGLVPSPSAGGGASGLRGGSGSDAIQHSRGRRCCRRA